MRTVQILSTFSVEGRSEFAAPGHAKALKVSTFDIF